MLHAAYSKKFEKGYQWFYEKNPSIATKIDELKNDVLEHPRTGLGKPERLRYKVDEMWSRHIDKKNRLVYTICDGAVYFESCEGRYGDH